MPIQSLTLGTRQQDGSVLLDPAEAEYIARVLGSVRQVETKSVISERAWGDGGYTAHTVKGMVRALAEHADPATFHRITAPNPNGVMIAADHYRVDVRLAVIVGGIAPWPKADRMGSTRESEGELAQAWFNRERQRGVMPGRAAFQLNAEQVRPVDFIGTPFAMPGKGDTYRGSV